ncbi:protein of unknown function [Vibrio tapetis subsp. tapetis]|uniref:Uncharacterized protein n=1 Tax=Vibrio tapetis subsp. tapetis TaxID=1671868 RepID=A0A2N8ZBC9_9VIBR|nr:protein of unknown function [Vibrio tapetis subsp. tapetis]
MAEGGRRKAEGEKAGRGLTFIAGSEKTNPRIGVGLKKTKSNTL